MQEITVCMIGNYSGTTSLILRLLGRGFFTTLRTTQPIDFYTHIFDFEGEQINLQIADVGGFCIDSPIARFDVYIIVYSVASYNNFHQLDHQVKVVTEANGGPPTLIIVGNKIDMLSEIVISPEQGFKKACEIGATFLETSAFLNYNVTELLETIREHRKSQNIVQKKTMKSIFRNIFRK